MTTNSKRFLLTSLIIVSIVAFAFIFRLSENKDEKTLVRRASLSTESTGKSVDSVKSTQPEVTHSEARSSVGPQRFFLANRQFGVIGIWGGNQVDNPVDNIFTVEVNEPITDKDAVWLTYRLRGVKDFSNVSCSVNDRLAFGGYQVKTTDSSSVQRIQLSPEWLIAGSNRIHFGLPENANFGYKVSELSIEILKDGAGSPLIAQTSPTSYKGMVYVHGSVTRCKSARVKINGTSVKVIDNEFEALVPASGKRISVLADLDGKPYLKLISVGQDAQPDTVFAFDRSFERQHKLFIKGKSNQLRVKNAKLLVDQTSLKVTQTLSLTSLRCVDVPAMDLGLTNVTDVNSGFRFLPHGVHFSKPATVAIKYDRTKIPEGYTENDIRTFYFDPNTKHWVALERDSVNKDICMVVSRTTHFTDMINGIIKAPESPETQGFTPTMMNDIKVADPSLGIQLISPPTANNMGSANLTYNLEMPPARGGISPNLAIQYNSDGGSGWLGEGWDLYAPSITVDTRWGVPRFDSKYETETYNMGGVKLATIVDTLKHPSIKDTLGLVSVAHKGILFERLKGISDAGVQYHPVVESDFSRITRHGSNPSNYSWKVVTKDGLTYTYGGDLDNNSNINGSVKTFEYISLTSPLKFRTIKDVIAEWRLSTVEDQYRNFCRYYYVNDSLPVLGSDVYARYNQLNRIEIGRLKGNKSSDVDTVYQTVEFIQSTQRMKFTTNARYGFLTTTNPNLLDVVIIKQRNPDKSISQIRKYILSYKQGVFNTNLLDKVSQCDGANLEVASHTFSYFNNISNKYFKPEEIVNTTSVERNSTNPNNATTKGLPALGGGESDSWGGSFFVGVDFGFDLGIIECKAGVGFNYSTSKNTSDTKMMMIDINGDGLPDKLYKGELNGSSCLCFIPNLGDGLFGVNGIPINGYNDDISHTVATSSTYGWRGQFSAGAKKGIIGGSLDVGMDWLTGSSNTATYLADVNSDGLIDFIHNGNVYFNTIKSYINGVAIPSFSTNSGISPRPIVNIKSIRGKAGVLKLSDVFLQTPTPSKNDTLSSVLVVSDEPIQRDSDIVLREKRDDYENIPMQDVVRMWEAPRSGTISIKTHIKFLGDPSVEDADGVRLAIQTNGHELWKDSIKPTDLRLDWCTEKSDIEVAAGQRFYFRVQSGSNIFSDGLEDVVLWNQVMEYKGPVGVNDWSSYLDENRNDLNRYDSKEACFVSQQFDNIVDSFDISSSISIGGSFSKPVSTQPVFLKLIASADSLVSHDTTVMETYTDSLTNLPDTSYIKYKVWKLNDFYTPEYVAWQATYGTEAVSIDDLQLSTTFGGVDCPIHFRFEISSTTNLPWEEIIWKPQLRYIHAGTGRDTTLYAGVKYNIFEKKNHAGEGNEEYLSGYCDMWGHYERPYSDEPVIQNININSSRDDTTQYTLVLYRKEGYSQVPIAKYNGVIKNNVLSSQDDFVVPSLDFGSFFFSLYINDTISPDLITATCHFKNCSTAVVFKPNIYCLQQQNRTLFGHMWRGWGQFQYNAGNGRYAKPIVEDSLYIPHDTSEEAISSEWGLEKMCFFNMNHKPYKDSYYWSGSNDYFLIAGDTICTGRLNYGEMPKVLSPTTDDMAVITENSASANALELSPSSNNNVVTINPTPNLSGSIYEIKNAPILSNRTEDAYTAWGGATAKVGKIDKSAGYSHAFSKGKTKVTSAYLDLNGDGFPDYITDSKVEYTNPNGGRDGEITSIENENSSNESSSNGYSGGLTAGFDIKAPGSTKVKGGANAPSQGSPSSASSTLAKDLNVSLGVNASFNKNTSVATTSYIDVNGDGLPDRIQLQDNKVFVYLNQGYGFSKSIDWGQTKIAITQSNSQAKGGSIGGGATEQLWDKISENSQKKFIKYLKKKNIGLDVGINIVETRTYSLFCLFDLNMDGLPDKVFKDNLNNVAVEFNIGSGFAKALTMNEIEEYYKSFSSSTGFTLALNIKIKLNLFLKLALGASGSQVTSTDYIMNQMLDIDGDGFADVVKANGEPDKLAELKVKRSQIGYTNKLQSVSNSMGGNIALQYCRSQATYNHPGGKWVMCSVSTNDGITDDGAAAKDTFIYDGGKYDRYEREFIGFSDVLTENIKTDTVGKPIYRIFHQTFDNSNFYTKGALKNTELIAENGKIFSASYNGYNTYSVYRLLHSTNIDTLKWGKYSMLPIDPNVELSKANTFLHQYIIYSPSKYSRNTAYSYSGNTQSSMVSSESYSGYNTAPGTHGELLFYKYSDKGGLGENGSGAFNYQTNINYLRNKPLMTLFVLPISVIVKDSDGKVYRRTEAVWNDNFSSQLRIVKNVIGIGDTAITTLGYDAWGNLSQKVLPGEIDTSRMWYKYEYDKFYHLFPTKVSDKYGYSSYMSNYNYKFGIPCRTTDINGNVMLTSLDDLGRVLTITSPNEVANSKPKTLRFEYHSKATLSSGKITSPANAITFHYDESHPLDDIETVTFSDGFGRPIQVNKDASVNGSPAIIISGRVKYDPFGRVTKAYYPTIETISGNKYTFHTAFDDLVPPMETTYDVLDRVTSVKQPDGNTTSTSYGIVGGMFKTTLTDAMGGTQGTFANGSGLTMKTEQYSGPEGTITTTFEYDAINQPKAVIDTKGETTKSIYDLAGRRTKLIHPASGTTLFGYDKAGNLTTKKTANLALTQDSITYTYEYYNRLKSIHYPQHPENDVTYTYGTYADTTTANGNRAGRLKYLVDGSGAQEFKYGRMGEITENRRTLVIPNQAIATYVTNWTYDSWNRVRTMTYPDGEILSYSYDVGGQLAGLTGSKAGFNYPYVKAITYDRFEQRNYIMYGNDAETRYTYNDSTRNLMGLSVLSTKLDPNRPIMNNAYTFDKVSNVLSVTNSAEIIQNHIGGQMSHHYQYDGLYRLASANGSYTGAGLAPNQKKANYQLTMAYDNLHNITGKKQTLEQQNLQFAGVLKTGYDLTYAYDEGKPQQIATIADTSYRTEGAIVKQGKTQSYSYDANGNMLSVNTTQPAPDGSLRSMSNRRLLWDEENRLLSVSDNGFVSNYWYDASGERTLKMSGENEGVLVNGILSGGRTGTSNYTAYVNPYMVITNGGQMSKHFYIGSQRVISQLCSSGSMFDATKNPQSTTKAAALKVNYTAKYDSMTSKVKTRFDSLGVAYHGTNNAGAGFWTYSAPVNETDQYYFHSDHLGSSSLITNLGGDLVQHIEYVPFGEVLVDERTSIWGTPYKFNAKELDEETGLYYYGARYLDPRTSVWLGVDPLAEEYPGISSYVFCANNPIKYIDPDGKVIIPVHGTWARTNTWKNLNSITNASLKLFGDNKLGKAFAWSGGNYAIMRTSAAKALVNNVRSQLAEKGSSEPVTLAGHSHGGNLCIEAINMMVEMEEFKDVKFNLLTINTPVRKDYQLSENAQKRVTHVNVYDPQDPVQTNGGNSIVILPDNPSSVKFTGEYGAAGRTFPKAKNIEVNNPQGVTEVKKIGGRNVTVFGDFHNSHNRVNDWINEAK